MLRYLGLLAHLTAHLTACLHSSHCLLAQSSVLHDVLQHYASGCCDSPLCRRLTRVLLVLQFLHDCLNVTLPAGLLAGVSCTQAM
jgi:hypothetical protein